MGRGPAINLQPPPKQVPLPRRPPGPAGPPTPQPIAHTPLVPVNAHTASAPWASEPNQTTAPPGSRRHRRARPHEPPASPATPDRSAGSGQRGLPRPGSPPPRTPHPDARRRPPRPVPLPVRGAARAAVAWPGALGLFPMLRALPRRPRARGGRGGCTPRPRRVPGSADTRGGRDAATLPDTHTRRHARRKPEAAPRRQGMRGPSGRDLKKKRERERKRKLKLRARPQPEPMARRRRSSRGTRQPRSTRLSPLPLRSVSPDWAISEGPGRKRWRDTGSGSEANACSRGAAMTVFAWF